MIEPRHRSRLQASGSVLFRIVREGSSAKMSEPAQARIRELTMQGMWLETSLLEVDGLHISFNDHPFEKNQIYLQWDLPSRRTVKAIAETLWYERLSFSEPLFLVGLKFSSISEEDKRAIGDCI